MAYTSTRFSRCRLRQGYDGQAVCVGRGKIEMKIKLIFLSLVFIAQNIFCTEVAQQLPKDIVEAFQAKAFNEDQTVKLISDFIEEGGNVEAKNQLGHTMLICAAIGNRVQVMKYLIGEHGADINNADNRGHTAIMLAAHNANLEAFKALLEWQACITKTSITRESLFDIIQDQISFFNSITNKHTNKYKKIMHNIKSLLNPEKLISEAIQDSPEEDSMYLLRLIIKSKMHIGIRYNGGLTPAMLAAQQKKAQALIHLLNEGSELDAVNFQDLDILDYSKRLSEQATVTDYRENERSYTEIYKIIEQYKSKIKGTEESFCLIM